MKKVIKIGFPIVCIVIIGGTFYMLGNLDKKVDDSLRKQYSNSVNEKNTIRDEENENIISEDVTYTVPVEFDTDEESTEDSDEENTSSNTESSENSSSSVENMSNTIDNSLSNNSNIAENNN